MRLRIFTALLAAWAAMSAGCADPQPIIPDSVAAYQQAQADNRLTYARQTTLMYNLQRVLDRQATVPDRLESLNLVLHLGRDDTLVTEQLADVLDQPQCPHELRQAVSAHLAQRGYARRSPATAATPDFSREEDYHGSAGGWATTRPFTESFAETVRQWAGAVSAGGDSESSFRKTVEEYSGKPWDQALLAGINGGAGFPRGRALEVLATRLPDRELKGRILSQTPVSDAMASLQSFIEMFDFLPTTRTEFAAVVTVFKTRLDLFAQAARLQSRWRQQDGYDFNVRDFHLLSRLAGDPLRTPMSRTELALELMGSINGRPYIAMAPGPAERRVVTDRFSPQSHTLTLADMWNLHLLDHMLQRPRMQLALRMMAQRNRTGAEAAQSGLIFYRNGQAEAMLYPRDASVPAGNGPYLSDQMIRDGRDSLAVFHTHFEKADNNGQAGPSQRELTDSQIENHYGLVLTSVGDNALAAHYYNPQGIVVSLGRYELRQ